MAIKNDQVLDHMEQLNPMLIPTNPEERVKLWMSMLEKVKAELKSGELKDWGICADFSAGYSIRETDEVTLNAAILKTVPYFICDSKPLLTADQAIESLKRVVAAARTK